MAGPRSSIATLVVPTVALAMLALAAAALWGELGEDGRAALAALLTPPRVGLLVLFVLMLTGVLAWVTHRLVAPFARDAGRIAEAARVVAHGNPEHRLKPDGHPELRAVTAAINELAEVRAKLLVDVETAATTGKARVEEERSRLAALIAELDQSVLVCNREGSVLLYNAAAAALLGDSGKSVGGELLGLGRSVFGIIDRALIVHALEALERQVAREERESTHFVTATADGRLLRVQAAPVTGTGNDPAAAHELAGYVLLLSDVTEKVETDARRAALFRNVFETTRAALANIRAAIENLTEHPDLEAARRARFAAIIRDEAVRLSNRLHELAGDASEGLNASWPLEDMRGEDLLTLVRSRIERRTGLPTKLESADSALWLRVDSFPLAQGLCYLAQRLKDEFKVREVRFRLLPVGAHAQLDVLWRGPPMSSETAFGWQGEPFTQGGEDSPLTLAQVSERHGGELWYQFDVPMQMAYFRFLLPLAGGRAGALARSAPPSRPEFYDFDLFHRSPAAAALDDRPLVDLAYTVFDTETTGLNPAAGDEIIAIGAVRIVNGRRLQGETFESLIDPRRAISEPSAAVHGITPEMLAGQPTIDSVLPRFRRFVEDTVLVGHNAAFDMRFLELNEARTGIRFDQPVLDTLLLSAVANPAQESHGLEEIAMRLGVEVVGRHTALGDALVTADVFLRLLPLLAERGIRTLGQARAASEKTYYARLKY